MQGVMCFFHFHWSNIPREMRDAAGGVFLLRRVFFFPLCVDGELVCAEGYTQVTGVMAMMMTGRVLLVCALCVLWCGLSRAAADDTVKDEKTVEGLSSPHPSSPVSQEEPPPPAAAEALPPTGGTNGGGGGGGQTRDSQEGKAGSIAVTGTDVSEEREVKLDEHPPQPTGGQDENNELTETAALPPLPPAPPPRTEESPRLSHSEEVLRPTTQENDELKKAQEPQDGSIQHESTKQHEEPLQQEEKQRSEEQPQHQEEVQNQQDNQKQLKENIKQEKEQQKQQEKQQQKEEPQDKQNQQPHEHPTEKKNETTKDKNAIRTNATANTGDSDSSTAVYHSTSPLLLLLVACATAAAVVAA
ncbi:mucin-associated surface protein (MASP), putative [Trypanosoma cruzi marinkellei]|uniref:Mucin-associated surface protein (MASP), putative n=1 Tax=Trypanosoma cruzi marinkellei TaxID=85056 RepID=K2MQS4_TRYCR|nr:mucin-associated surface protein (MASP), putative [Trypanosoma cruzi marinkellei]